jgi:hypothetical protein
MRALLAVVLIGTLGCGNDPTAAPRLVIRGDPALIARTGAITDPETVFPFECKFRFSTLVEGDPGQTAVWTGGTVETTVLSTGAKEIYEVDMATIRGWLGTPAIITPGAYVGQQLGESNSGPYRSVSAFRYRTASGHDDTVVITLSCTT